MKLSLPLLFLCLSLGAQPMPFVQPRTLPGCVGYWPMNEGSGTVAQDWSGLNQPLTNNSLLFCPGIIGSAITNASAIGVINYPGNVFSLSCWCFQASLSAPHVIFSVGNYVSTGWHVYNGSSTCAASTKLAIVRSGTSCDVLNNSGPTFTTNKWQHVAIVFNGSTWSAYLDGIFRATGTSLPPTTPSPAEVTTCDASIGIDEVQIYNRALSPSEILYLYSQSPYRSQ